MPHDSNTPQGEIQIRPWYKEPWPWVAIAIPAIAVIGGLFTLYLAITHPDPLVVDSDEYQRVHSTLHAQAAAQDAQPAEVASRDRNDGEH